MLKLLSYKIMSVSMAILVVLASFSFTIEKHFCGPNLVAISVISNIESCCKGDIPKDKSVQFSTPPCCTNAHTLIEGFDNYPTITTVQALNNLVVAILTSNHYTQAFELEPKLNPSNFNYRPPPLVVNIQVRDQVFLI